MTSTGSGISPPSRGALQSLSLAPGFSRAFDANESRSRSRSRVRSPAARRLSIGITAWLTWLSFVCVAAEAPSFRFRTNDVIAFVGGEDVVEMQRNGYLELLLTTARPNHHLRFRNLAFEGDTVFEQHRQLNFPSWEQQLQRVGATVVIAQFGQAESLQDNQSLAEFLTASEKLLERLAGTNRQLVVLAPTPIEKLSGTSLDMTRRNFNHAEVVETLRNVADRHRWRFVEAFV